MPDAAREKPTKQEVDALCERANEAIGSRPEDITTQTTLIKDPNDVALMCCLVETLEDLVTDPDAHAEAIRNHKHNLSTIATQAAEISRLRAELGEAHKTADGKAIRVGMKVWWWCEGSFDEMTGASEPAEWVRGRVTYIGEKQFNEYLGEVTIGVDNADWEGGNLEVFASKDAAFLSAAKEQGDG